MGDVGRFVAPSPAHPRLALLALSLGGFAIGVTEFAALGLLPDIAADLLPGVWATSHADADAQTGWMVSAYALGVVVGAPTIAALAAKRPHKGLLLTLVACIVVATLLTAVLPSFGLVVTARFLAGVPHGAYFGVASLVAGELLGPGNRAKAMAWVIGGLTVANIVGVPAVTALGQATGWRGAFLVVAGLFLAAFVAIALVVPKTPADRTATVANELRAFRKPQLWLTVSVAAVGAGGLFAVYSYIAPIATSVTGLPARVVPVVLIVFGVGMTVGNLLAGRFLDRNVWRGLFAAFFAMIGALVLMTLTVRTPVGLFVTVFGTGVTISVLAPAIQVRLQEVAHESRTIGAALNHSALNIANSIGAALGGVVIAAGFGFAAPIEVGLALTIGGLVLALVSLRLERRDRAAGASLGSSGRPAVEEV